MVFLRNENKNEELKVTIINVLQRSANQAEMGKGVALENNPALFNFKFRYLKMKIDTHRTD